MSDQILNMNKDLVDADGRPIQIPTVDSVEADEYRAVRSDSTSFVRVRIAWAN